MGCILKKKSRGFFGVCERDEKRKGFGHKPQNFLPLKHKMGQIKKLILILPVKAIQMHRIKKTIV